MYIGGPQSDLPYSIPILGVTTLKKLRNTGVDNTNIQCNTILYNASLFWNHKNDISTLTLYTYYILKLNYQRDLYNNIINVYNFILQF